MVAGVVVREMCLVLEECPCCRSGLIAWMQTTDLVVERALESSCWNTMGSCDILSRAACMRRLDWIRCLSSDDGSNRTAYNAREKQSAGLRIRDGQHTSKYC